jgi:pyridoxine/pyridoxamine 5'-phosphate oxidase
MALEPTLEEALADGWARLTRGARDRRATSHLVQVATVTPEGAPSLRTVVLRHADCASRELRFHTDQRAPKLVDLAREPRIAVLAYDEAARVQLRCDGRAALHRGDDLAATAWAEARASSRRCYASAQAPGQPLDAPGDGLDHLAPDADLRDSPIFERFVVVRVTVDRLEWLRLAAAGHRRARFDLTQTPPIGCWITP